jgi:thymidylate kinase
MAGIILEGVTGAGKTMLFRALQAWLVENRASNTKLLLSEHYSERALEARRKAGSLGEDDVLAHLATLLQPLSDLERLWSHSGFPSVSGAARVVTVIERFLLGHIVNMRCQEPHRWPAACMPAVERLYRQANALGLRTVVLVLPAGRLTERIRSTRLHRNAAWSVFLDSFGIEDAAIAHFERWQALLLTVVDRLQLIVQPQLIDMSDVTRPDDYADLARRLGEETFG